MWIIYINMLKHSKNYRWTSLSWQEFQYSKVFLGTAHKTMTCKSNVDNLQIESKKSIVDKNVT